MLANMRCGNCRFLGRDDEHITAVDDNPTHVCRRYAPRPSDIGGDPFAVWPIISTEEDWCGEWAEKLVEVPR